MKTTQSIFASVLTILLITLFLGGCGKKETSEGTGSSESKKEETEETKEQTKTEKTDETENNAGEVTKESTSSGNTSADQMIDEYQVIVDEYTKYVKEMQKGDMSNLKNMQELAIKTQEWSVKLTKIAPTFTEAQKQRLEKISKEAELYLTR